MTQAASFTAAAAQAADDDQARAATLVLAAARGVVEVLRRASRKEHQTRSREWPSHVRTVGKTVDRVAHQR